MDHNLEKLATYSAKKIFLGIINEIYIREDNNEIL